MAAARLADYNDIGLRMTGKVESFQILGRAWPIIASLPRVVRDEERSCALWARRSSRMYKAAKLEVVEEAHEL